MRGEWYGMLQLRSDDSLMNLVYFCFECGRRIVV